MPKTPDEIKKGLECCADHDGTCESCPYVEGECRAFEQLSADALALIQQLQADNAQQARCIENMTDKLNAMIEEAARLKAERDAAVKDIKQMVQAPYEPAYCEYCKKTEEECAKVNCWRRDQFEWRGVQKEGTK